MTFNILKIVTLAALGWALARTYGIIADKLDEEPGPEGSGHDAEPESRADQSAEPVPEASAEPELPAAPAASATAPQDLRKIHGIGPAIEGLLNARGIETWAQLAATEVSDLQAILDEAGPRYRVHDPSIWPAQAAELAQAN